MAVAAPARRAPAPEAPKRKPPAPKKKASPARKPAARSRPKAAAPRGSGSRAKTKAAQARQTTARRPAGNGQLIPLAVGRTAVVVRGLPDCRPVLRLTRGRAWIALLGMLLAGIVALNVMTLNLTASAGDIEAQRQTLREENSLLQRRLAERLSNQRVEAAASTLGLERPDGRDIAFRTAGPEQVRIAAERIAALD